MAPADVDRSSHAGQKGNTRTGLNGDSLSAVGSLCNCSVQLVDAKVLRYIMPYSRFRNSVSYSAREMALDGSKQQAHCSGLCSFVHRRITYCGFSKPILRAEEMSRLGPIADALPTRLNEL